MRRASSGVLLLLALTALPAVAQQPAQKKNITLKDMIGAVRPTAATSSRPTARRCCSRARERDPKDYATTSHIWLHDLERGRTFQLTNSARGESNPRFLPDGRIAFTSNRDTRNAWYVISPNGGEAVKLVEAATACPRAARSRATASTWSTPSRPSAPTRRSGTSGQEEGRRLLRRKEADVHAHLDVRSRSKEEEADHDRQHRQHRVPRSRPTRSGSRSPRTARAQPRVTRTGATTATSSWCRPRAASRVSSRPIAGPDNGPVWSPDGTMIAYSSSDRKNNSADQIRPEGDPQSPAASRATSRRISTTRSATSNGRRTASPSTSRRAEGLTSSCTRSPIDGGQADADHASATSSSFGDFSATRRRLASGW